MDTVVAENHKYANVVCDGLALSVVCEVAGRRSEEINASALSGKLC